MKTKKLILSAKSNAKLLTEVRAGLDGILITFQLSHCFLLLSVEDFRYFLFQQLFPEPGRARSSSLFFSLPLFSSLCLSVCLWRSNHSPFPPSSTHRSHPLPAFLDNHLFINLHIIDHQIRFADSCPTSTRGPKSVITPQADYHFFDHGTTLAQARFVDSCSMFSHRPTSAQPRH